MAIYTSSGTGRRQPMMYHWWTSSPWWCMPRWISRAKQVHFRGSRLQTGSSCLVVVKLASLVVSCGGHRPPNNATNQCVDWKTTRATWPVYSCPHFLCLCYLEPTGLHEKSTRWGSKLTSWIHHVSSQNAVITEPSPVVCWSHRLITFERVRAVGRFDVGRNLFVLPQQPRAGPVANRRCFWASPGHTSPQRAEKG